VDDEDDSSPSTTQRDYIPAVNIRLKGIMMGHSEVLLQPVEYLRVGPRAYTHPARWRAEQ
jgi:hypothetical protein